jgi:hypothetical protein
VTRDSGLGAGSARSLSNGHAVTVAPPGIVTARAALILQPAGGRARRPSQPVMVLDSAPKPSPRLMNVLVPHAPVDELSEAQQYTSHDVTRMVSFQLSSRFTGKMLQH